MQTVNFGIYLQPNMYICSFHIVKLQLQFINGFESQRVSENIVGFAFILEFAERKGRQ